MTRTDLASLLINTLMDNELEIQRQRRAARESGRPVRRLSVVPDLEDES